jgi:hypothetical protein
VKFEEALQATVGAVAPTHGQECDIDLGLAQGHIDIPIHKHGAGFMSHVAHSSNHSFASTDRSITFNGEATKEHTDLRAGTHSPRVPFIWSSVKKNTLNRLRRRSLPKNLWFVVKKRLYDIPRSSA